jgi:hypothetical protein
MSDTSQKELARLNRIHKKLKKAIKKLIKKAFDTVKDITAFIADKLAKIGTTIAKIIDDVTDIIEAALGKILPDFVTKIVSVIISIIDFGAYLDAAFLQNLSNFIKSGKLLDLLDFVSPTVHALIQKMRAEARPKSLSTPKIVVEQIPDSVFKGQVGDILKYNHLKNLDTRFFWQIWAHFKGEKTAICMIDTIIFVDETDFRQPHYIFEYLHEAKHFAQYASMGSLDFVRSYLKEEIFKSGINKFESEADVYACSIYPFSKPAYIGVCP